MNTVTSAFQIKSLCLNSWQARSSPAPVKKWCVAVFLVGSLTVMWFFVFIVSWSFPGRLASSEWSGYFSSLCPLRRSSRHSPASCCCKMTKVSYWNLKCTNTHTNKWSDYQTCVHKHHTLNLLDEASVAVMLGVLFPLLLLLVLPLIALHIILPVLLPLLGLVHHLTPLSLHLLCRELPTSDRTTWKINQFSVGGDKDEILCNMLQFKQLICSS